MPGGARPHLVQVLGRGLDGARGQKENGDGQAAHNSAPQTAMNEAHAMTPKKQWDSCQGPERHSARAREPADDRNEARSRVQRAAARPRRIHSPPRAGSPQARHEDRTGTSEIGVECSLLGPRYSLSGTRGDDWLPTAPDGLGVVRNQSTRPIKGRKHTELYGSNQARLHGSPEGPEGRPLLRIEEVRPGRAASRRAGGGGTPKAGKELLEKFFPAPGHPVHGTLQALSGKRRMRRRPSLSAPRRKP
jgi:hypothetical protein